MTSRPGSSAACRRAPTTAGTTANFTVGRSAVRSGARRKPVGLIPVSAPSCRIVDCLCRTRLGAASTSSSGASPGRLFSVRSAGRSDRNTTACVRATPSTACRMPQSASATAAQMIPNRASQAGNLRALHAVRCGGVSIAAETRIGSLRFLTPIMGVPRLSLCLGGGGLNGHTRQEVRCRNPGRRLGSR